jgi:hypothetical protein
MLMDIRLPAPKADGTTVVSISVPDPYLEAMRNALAIVLAGALLVASPSLAAQGPGRVPPGNSGADQYVESVPGAGGNHPGTGNPASHAGAVPPGTQRALTSEGPAGRATASLAGATAPRGGGFGSKNGAAPAPSGGGGSAVGGIAQGAVGSNSTGMGVWLPLVLGASLLGAILLLALRRRGAGRSGSPPST